MEIHLPSPDTLYQKISEKLGRHPGDFPEKWQMIRHVNGSGTNHRAAGVLLLLQDRPVATQDGPSTEYFFQLIKRSGQISQGGDISCPGGMLDPSMDGLLSLLTLAGLPPVLRSNARRLAHERPDGAFRVINLFLANALRESWEEVHLSPFNVEFLGPLPTHSLVLFNRTIFPLVARVKRPWTFRPNEEVDRVIEIPLASFFDQANYAGFTIESPAAENGSASDTRDFPCFVHHEAGQDPEILWGATFNIIINFLRIVFDFQLPAIAADRRYRRVISPEYLTGTHHER